MKITIIIYFLLLCGFNLNAQHNETDAQAQSEIKKLQFITGTWKGNGWMMMNDGEKHEFQQTELVQFKLDSTAILIEGLGKSEGQVIHDAWLLCHSINKTKITNFNPYYHQEEVGALKLN
jgi:hypothetical protein